MSLISDSPTLKPPAQTSAPQNTAVGGGSRPTPSKMKIPSSAPTDAYTLERAPEGFLKHTGPKEAPLS